MLKQNGTRILTILLLAVFSIGWENSIKVTTAISFGKIYLRDNLLMVAELTKGVRLLDITNPSTPKNLAFIKVEGNHDMALASTGRGLRTALYLDSYAHLIVYDFSDPSNPSGIDTIYNVFQKAYDIGWGDPMPRMPSIDPSTNRRYGGFDGCRGCIREPTMYEPVPHDSRDYIIVNDGLRGTPTGGSGRGGSMARFAIVNQYLYCVDYNQIHVFDVTDPFAPRFIGKDNIGWGIETIFPYQNYLFIGSETGMYIYSLSNPRRPEFISRYVHLRACDPVVVEDSIAYVTLRGGTQCGTVVSALHIIDLKNIFQPQLISSYPLPQPMGLDVSNRIAYVCDDSVGVYILNTRDPKSIVEFSHIPGEHGYDTILSDMLLIVVSRSNIAFYNVSNPQQPMLVGRYPD